MPGEGTRLNKYISEAGVASRRAADRLVEEGRVTINGRVAVLGDKVSDGDVVAVDGREVRPKGRDVILAFNNKFALVQQLASSVMGWTGAAFTIAMPAAAWALYALGGRLREKTRS